MKTEPSTSGASQTEAKRLRRERLVGSGNLGLKVIDHGIGPPIDFRAKPPGRPE